MVLFFRLDSVRWNRFRRDFRSSELYYYLGICERACVRDLPQWRVPLHTAPASGIDPFTDRGRRRVRIRAAREFTRHNNGSSPRHPTRVVHVVRGFHSKIFSPLSCCARKNWVEKKINTSHIISYILIAFNPL